MMEGTYKLKRSSYGKPGRILRCELGARYLVPENLRKQRGGLAISADGMVVRWNCFGF
jgi:hypothetical protein